MDKRFEIAGIIVAFVKGEVTPEQTVRLEVRESYRKLW